MSNRKFAFGFRNRSLKRLTGVFFSPFTWIFRGIDRTATAIARIAVFVAKAAWTSAQFWNLVRGVPAIAVIIGTVVIANAIQAGRISATAYLQEARAAVARGDFQQAELYFSRVVEISGGTSEVLLDIAQLALETGDGDRAEAILDRIAPLSSAGYAPAHLLRAKLILAGPPNFERLSLAETHLLHATSGSVLYPKAKGELGNLYLQTNEPQKAKECLIEACETNPEYSLSLARTFSILGDRQRAETRGQIAVDYFRKLTDAEPTNLEYRRNWAAATNFLLRFEDALIILQHGIALKGDEAQIRKDMGEVCIAWFDETLLRYPDDYAAQFRIMVTGIQANPAEVNFLQRAMTVIQRDDPDADKARAIMRQMISSGNGAALAHLILGTDAIEQLDPDQAIKHLEMAIKMDPGMGVAANNLAWALAFKDPPELERALALIDAIANRWPDYGAYRDTRGQILAKLERWDEALADLQAALPQLGNDRQLHETLALVYEKIGLHDMALEHADLARSLAEKKP